MKTRIIRSVFRKILILSLAVFLLAPMGFKKEAQAVSQVEAGIVLPLMTILLFGIVDFGLQWNKANLLTNPSAEGARSGAIRHLELMAQDVERIIAFVDPIANGTVSEGNVKQVRRNYARISGLTNPQAVEHYFKHLYPEDVDVFRAKYAEIRKMAEETESILAGELPPEDCTDQQDNDGDGDVDCADSDCAQDPTCNSAEICDNGVDDDQDNLEDCKDPDCDRQICDPNGGRCIGEECVRLTDG